MRGKYVKTWGKGGRERRKEGEKKQVRAALVTI